MLRITADTMEYLLYDRHRLKCFTYMNSVNSHDKPKYDSHFIAGETRAHRLK